MKNPKCTFCSSEAGFFPMFSIFAPGHAFAKIGDVTFDAPFCDTCRQRVKVKDVLTDDIWQSIQRRVRRDAAIAKVPIPPLERGRTILNFRPFIKQEMARQVSPIVIDIKADPGKTAGLRELPATDIPSNPKDN